MLQRFERRHIWYLAASVLLMLTLLGSYAVTPAQAQTVTSGEIPNVGSIAPQNVGTSYAMSDTSLEGRLIALYEAASPSVVRISSRNYARFMGQIMPQGGSGTGFVYDAEGHIVTNYHVIEDADEILVIFPDERALKAKIVGQDPLNDLAVLRVEADEALPSPLALGDSSALRVGQFVVAIGNPFGLEQSLTIGIVSALSRVIRSPRNNRYIGEAIQTDAAINPGNSGGPLLDLTGNVVGVNSQIISASGSSSGIGFAVPASTVQRIVPALIDQGYYAHPWIGAQLFELNPFLADALREAEMNLPVESGLLILRTVDDAPAAAAGFRGSTFTTVNERRLPLGGDVIVAINGEPVETFRDFTVYLQTKTTVGETVDMTIITNGETRQVEVTLAQQPRDRSSD
jgi:S1-C subfamily serine protease